MTRTKAAPPRHPRSPLARTSDSRRRRDRPRCQDRSGGHEANRGGSQSATTVATVNQARARTRFMPET